MANTSVRVRNVTFPTDASTFDITVAGESRNPTGAFVVGTYSTALNTSAADLGMCAGVTDFTTTAVVSATDEDAQSVQDAQHNYNASNLVRLMVPGTNTVNRSATATAISGGIRLTPGQTGTAWRLKVILVFGSACKAFSAGDGTASGTPYNVAHGFSTEPGAGIYAYNETGPTDTDDPNGDISIGYHAYDGAIQQACFAQTGDDGAAVTTAAQAFVRGVTTNARVGMSLNPATENHNIELTAIDTTNITFTPRLNTQVGDLIGLLIECDDVSSAVALIDSPTTAASDWNYAGLSFTPQFVSMVLNRCAADATSELDADAGPWGMCSMDEDGIILCANFRREDGITLGTTNTASRIDQDLRFMINGADTATHDMDNHTFTSTGWTFAAADITTADGTVRKWPMLAIETASTTTDVNYHGIGRGIMRGIGRGIG